MFMVAYLWFLTSEGVIPNSLLKLSLKLPTLLKPVSIATSEMQYCSFWRSIMLLRSLAFLMYSFALIPVRAFTLR